MNIQEFLEHLKYLHLEEGEKENRILCQKDNFKRSSKQTTSQKNPFM